MSKPHGGLLKLLVVVGFLATVTPAWAQNYQIIDERLDPSRHGYTVIRVWGSHYDMGFGMGAAFAGDIVTGVGELQGSTGSMYAAIKAVMQSAVWVPAEIEDEITGIADGVQSVQPGAAVDAADIKVLNTWSDWYYATACRSHSCWGDFVQAPVKTLSTRRLDLPTPIDAALHHVMCAWDPGDGSVRWVNLAFPGYVSVITGVNAYGTQVSLHDYGPGATTDPGTVARSVALRHILTGVGSMPAADHRTWAQGELNNMSVATSSFLNYFVPEGHGGVFTCPMGGPCGELRTPQTDYFGGQVLITTNSQTDGHSMPGGGDEMHNYYQAGGVKTLQDHFGLMGTSGLHLMSVEVRGTEDMTIWAHGRGRSDFIQVEWANLFPQGSSSSSSSSSVSSSGSDADDADDGTVETCACRTVGGAAPAPWFLLGFALLLMRRRRHQPH